MTFVEKFHCAVSECAISLDSEYMLKLFKAYKKISSFFKDDLQ